jgi:CheY-like chemotaxis protein
MINTICTDIECNCEMNCNIPENINEKFGGHDFVEILLVEDNVADVRLVKEIFKDFKINTKIHVVEDGIEALNYLYKTGEYKDAQKPDIVHLDTNLPKKDGIEVLYEIKTDKNLKYIPTIVLTSSYDTDEIENSYCRYINCYVAKPFYLDQYMDIILFIMNFQLTASKLPKTVNIRPSFNLLPQLS